MKVYYYTHRIPPTSVGQSCGHLPGGALQKIYTLKYYRCFWKQSSSYQMYGKR
jgi:hypothetical protein